MAVYTVHEPPPKRYEAESNPDRFVFVRDGFSFWAFLLGPLWMLRHRMWLVLIGYVLIVVGLHSLVGVLDLSETASIAIGGFLALLVGFEAATLRRFTLARRRWRNVGVIVGDDVEGAEQRFFDAWAKRANASLATSPLTMPGQQPSIGYPELPPEWGTPA